MCKLLNIEITFSKCTSEDQNNVRAKSGAKRHPHGCNGLGWGISICVTIMGIPKIALWERLLCFSFPNCSRGMILTSFGAPDSLIAYSTVAKQSVFLIFLFSLALEFRDVFTSHLPLLSLVCAFHSTLDFFPHTFLILCILLTLWKIAKRYIYLLD